MRRLSTLFLFLLIIVFISCESASQKADEMTADVVFETEVFTTSSGDLSKTDHGIVNVSGDSWIVMEVQVPSPGRYKTEVLAKGNGTAWVEDYHDNPDGRTYNITGEIMHNSPGFSLSGKDGSPLNTGLHKMKLHVSGDGFEVDRVQFTKMIGHQETPKSLTQSVEGKDWKLVWSDEFEREGAPDASKWTYDVGNWGWGNNEPQYYTDDRRENARLEDGNLIIEARKNDMGQEWTSARLTTRGKVSFLYGKIEFKAKVPAKDGTWAAGWLLGDEYVDELSWPYCGEIDVLECVGSEIDDETSNGINHGSCHTRTYYFKEGTHITAEKEVKDMQNTFHTYAIEWTPDGIKAFVDGEHYYTYDKTKDELEWPFSKPQNLIVNLAMGGGMGGAIDPSSDREQFILDYIRVYELQ